MNSVRLSSVSSGIWTLFSIATLTLTALMALQAWHLFATRDIAANLLHRERVEGAWQELGEDLVDAETGQRGYILTGDPRYLAPYHSGIIRIARDLDTLDRLSHDASAPTITAQLRPIIAAKLAELSTTIQLTQNGQRAAALDIIRSNRGKRLMDALRHLRSLTLDQKTLALDQQRQHFLAEINSALHATLFFGLMALLALLLLALKTSRQLQRPIQQLLDGLQSLAQGDLQRRVPLQSHDEIGRLTAAFNQMAERLQKAHDERDLAIAELQRSNADLDSFAYVASHDLKAPLRGIRHLSEWISEDLGDSITQETRENLQLLRNRVDRLEALLEGLLEYARVGRRDELIEDVDSGLLLLDISRYLSPAPGFEIAADGPLPTLKTCKAPLEKVLRNLISNALKHHDGSTGKVSVGARDTGDMIEFAVTDDGPGIAAPFHDKIFQMFQTLKPRDAIEGSGMGLAIVKKTVESVGGSIRVESQPPQRGATFLFTWPKNTIHPAQTASAPRRNVLA